MVLVVRRFDVFLVNLDPTVGSEIQKTRPCVVISPDEMNRYVATVIIAPMTTKGKEYPTRVFCQFQGKDGQIVLDLIRQFLSGESVLPVVLDLSKYLVTGKTKGQPLN